MSEADSQRSSKPSVESHGTKGGLGPLDEWTASGTQARTEMVQKVLEGPREEVFELARDIGVDVLTRPSGLRKFVDKLRDVVFPMVEATYKTLDKSIEL